jgi:hypothetical protein
LQQASRCGLHGQTLGGNSYRLLVLEKERGIRSKVCQRKYRVLMKKKYGFSKLGFVFFEKKRG